MRVTAWILRYVQNLRCKRKSKKEIDPLIKTAQRELHERVEKKEFNMLSPFTTEKEIIRVGGRAENAIVTYMIQSIQFYYQRIITFLT